MTDLLTSVQGSVYLLDLNRPHRLNALSSELVELLHQAIDEAESLDVRALVIAAQGRAFCGGFDLKQDLTPAAEIAQISRMQDLTTRLREISIPSVCAVHGHVVGGGLELALAADFILATPDARLSFPDVRAGFAVGGAATFLLPRMIGLARTRLILLTGGELSGADALDAGMIAKTVDAEALRPEALALAEQLAALAPHPLSLIRSGIDAGLHSTLAEALEREMVDMEATKHEAAGAAAQDNFRTHGRYAAT